MKIIKSLGLVCAFILAGTTQAANDIKLVNKGELRVLTNLIYPPMGFINPDNGMADGFDIELVREMAKRLGLEPIFVPSTFADLQSALQTGRGDLVIAGLSDNSKRQAAMDFVDYIVSGPILFTLKANAASYKQAMDLCGKTIAGSRNGIFPVAIPKWSDENCVAQGKQAATFEGTADSNAARLGLKQGRYDAVVQGIESAAYHISKVELDTYVLVGEPILSNDLLGMAFKKDNPALRDKIAETLNTLIEDGTYAALLEKWGLSHTALPKALINGGK